MNTALNGQNSRSRIQTFASNDPYAAVHPERATAFKNGSPLGAGLTNIE